MGGDDCNNFLLESSHATLFQRASAVQSVAKTVSPESSHSVMSLQRSPEPQSASGNHLPSYSKIFLTFWSIFCGSIY